MSGLIKEFEILTDGSGAFTQTQSLVVPMRLVAAHLSIGGLANTVDLTLVATRPGVDAELTQTAGTNDSTLLTITNASASADYDVDGRVEQQFKLTVAQGGAAARGSLICYFSYDLTSKVTSALGTADAAAIGSLTETAPATDTASSGLNGRLQRIAQRLTTIIAGLITYDGGPSWTSVFGVSGAPFASADAHSAAVAVTDAPTSGQKLVITDIVVSVDTAMAVTFTEEASGTVIAKFYMAANGVAQITTRGKRKLATVNKKLFVQTSVAGNIVANVGYYSEA